MTPILRLRDISYRFSEQTIPVLNRLNLDLHLGESLGVVGSNGSGKSTLLRIISSLLAPQKGEVLVGGQPVTHSLSAYRRQISYSAGGPLGFYPRLTGMENLTLFASFKGHALGRRETAALLERVGLTDAKDQIYFKYSLGMRQRLHLARLCLQPFRYVFVDEPSNGLDQEGRDLIVDLFKNELRDASKIVISHDRDLLEGLTQRIVALRAGELHAT